MVTLDGIRKWRQSVRMWPFRTDDERVQAAISRTRAENESAIKDRDRQIAVLQEQLDSLREQLEAEQVRTRITQMEVDLMAAINVRNIARIEAETAVSNTKGE